MMACLTGANLVHDVGLLGNATVVMPAMIVATSEIISMLHQLLEPVAVGDEDLALDVIRQVGPGGEFVTHQHTFEHFGDVWYPGLLYRGGAETWEASDRRFEDRVSARACELMERHEPEPLPAGVARAINAVVTRAEASLP
jgi:trimethylamine--corrinoid protein Co-methyltransferase